MVKWGDTIRTENEEYSASAGLMLMAIFPFAINPVLPV